MMGAEHEALSPSPTARSSQRLMVMHRKARTAGQLIATIATEVTRRELMRPYVKHVDSGHVSEFSRMSDEGLERSPGRPSRLRLRSDELCATPRAISTTNFLNT
jgi:hypothetical protein